MQTHNCNTLIIISLHALQAAIWTIHFHATRPDGRRQGATALEKWEILKPVQTGTI